MPSGYFDIDTVLLTSGANGNMDTTRANNNNGGFENAWTSKYFQTAAPSGFEFNSNGTTNDVLVAYAWTFKSGVPAVKGPDTSVFVYQLDPTKAPVGMRRNNYAGYGLFLNEGTTGWENTKAYNTALMALKGSSYASVNGWNGYIAGQAFNNERFVETYFHLTVTGAIGAGIEDAKNVEISGLYPNPATNSTAVRFTLNANNDVTISINNILGQEVATMDLGKVAAAKYDYNVDLSTLTPGMYTVSVKAGKSVQTQKLMVTE
jgi:hypothetical protein